MAAVGFCVLLTCTACGGRRNAPESHSRTLFAMDTYMSLTAYGDNAEKAFDAAAKRINAIEAAVSVTKENSDIQRVNLSGGTAEVSEDTAAIIGNALKIGSMTGGALDVTLYPAVKAWGFTSDSYRIPSKGELDGLRGIISYENVTLTARTVTVPSGYMLDLGAAAKGYTGDQLMSVFRENGVDSAIVSLGGNVQALGTKPDGSRWRVAVRDPLAPEKDICMVSVENCAVITSGNYERYFIGEDGVRYCHIIDRETLCPVQNGLASVTVVGESGSDCDCLSTALFVMGYDKACQFWRKNSGFELIIIDSEDKVSYTEGLTGSFEMLGGGTAEVISRA